MTAEEPILFVLPREEFQVSLHPDKQVGGVLVDGVFVIAEDDKEKCKDVFDFTRSANGGYPVRVTMNKCNPTKINPYQDLASTRVMRNNMMMLKKKSSVSEKKQKVYGYSNSYDSYQSMYIGRRR